MAAEVTVQPVEAGDVAAISDLHARVFGPGRFPRSAYRVREGVPLVSRLCLKATLDGRMVAAIRFTEVAIGGAGGAAMLGPLAVEPAFAGLGYGKRLIAEGVEKARRLGLKLVILVGNEPYYGRFGFRKVPAGRIRMPGPVDPDRLLAAELVPGALDGYAGLVTADKAAGTRPNGT